MVRKSKLTPKLFLNLMFYGIEYDLKSLRRISANAYREHSLEISKQAIDERFSVSSILFVKELLKKAIASQVRTVINPQDLQFFKTVRIKDSTKFEIHESFASEFKGSGKRGSSKSKSGVSIQYEFDLKNNNILDIDLQAEIQGDSQDALAKKNDIQKGDLIIRDLGYYSDKLLEHFIEKEAYFISKLNFNVAVRIKKADKQKVNFADIYNQMKKSGKTHLDLTVYIGEQRRAVRLIMLIVTDEIYEKRIRERIKKNNSKGYSMSDEYKSKAHFNFYICNIDESQCPWETICNLYRVRWQIELVFKIWKSILHIDQTYKMKVERLITTLYLKLFWIFINWQIISDCRNAFYKDKLRLLSLSKCFQTIIEYSQLLRKCLLNGKISLKNTLQKLIRIFQENHWSEKRKKRYNFEDYIELIFCNTVK
jgi:hypothetical protein